MGNGKPGVSNTFTGTLPAGLSRLTKLKYLCVLHLTPCHCGWFTVPACARLVSGRQKRLRYRSTWQLFRLVLRPSSVNFLVSSRPLSVRLHPTASGQRRIQRNRRLSKPWGLLERPQPRVRIGATFGSLKVSDHRDIGKNAFRGAFPAFVTSLTDLKLLYAPAISPSLAPPASMPASRCMKVPPRELLQRDGAGRDDCDHRLDPSVRKFPHPVALR